MNLKRFLRGMSVCLFLSIMVTLTAYADNCEWDRSSCLNPESVLLPPLQKKSIVSLNPFARGNIITNATLSISDGNDGTIKVYAQTLAYVKIDKCRMKIYLDKWVEDDKRWVTVDNWDFTITEPEPPETELTMATLSFNVINQPAGHYYRLRGLHAVWKSGQSESFSTQTDGVYITK